MAYKGILTYYVQEYSIEACMRQVHRLLAAELRMLRRGKDAWGTLVVLRYHEKGGTDTP